MVQVADLGAIAVGGQDSEFDEIVDDGRAVLELQINTNKYR